MEIIASEYSIGPIRERVFGADDRVPVPNPNAFPWRAIVPLRILAPSGQQFSGTGWLVGPRTVVTAGHCVYMHDDGGWPAQIDVLGAYPAVGRQFRAVRGWTAQREDTADVGCVVLDEAIGATTGWFSFGALDDPSLQAAEVTISGYPSDRGGGKVQYLHTRRVGSIDADWLTYDVDTYAGQSGSPVLRRLNGQLIVVGVHTVGASRANKAVRLTEAWMQRLRAWRALENT